MARVIFEQRVESNSAVFFVPHFTTTMMPALLVFYYENIDLIWLREQPNRNEKKSSSVSRAVVPAQGEPALSALGQLIELLGLFNVQRVACFPTSGESDSRLAFFLKFIAT